MQNFVAAAVIVTGFLGVQCVYQQLSKLVFKAPEELRNDALFGYSIAYQPAVKHLIISAPQGNIVGQVFDCDIKTQNCTEIIVEKIREESLALTNMWLGATVVAGNNFTVMCAPRFTAAGKTKNATFGRCYKLPASGGNATEMNYLSIEDKEFKLEPDEKYFDSFGWSANVDKRDSILIGGPAMYTGRAIKYPNVASTPILYNMVYNYTWNIKHNFGYSVTSGLFITSDENNIYYAISSPYGTFGDGKIILTNGVRHHPLDGPLEDKPGVGALFGASMCSAKLRGPKQREALLVGAPLYARDGQVDVGAVYVYQFDPAKGTKGRVVHQKSILGTANGGQFGSAVINLGDLNGDSKHEVAISAPYEESGRGAVYIYSAADILTDVSSDKIRWLQRIQPEEFVTIGLSLTALQNYADNGCNDLAIGAPYSNAVLMYRCLAQIIVHVQNLEELKTADYPGARRTDTLFVYNSCVEINYPQKTTYAKADIIVKVTLQHLTARIFNRNNYDSLTYRISTGEKKRTYCKKVEIEIREVSDYEPMIQYQITASQVDGPAGKSNYSSSDVLLSDLSTLTLTDKLWVADCTGGHQKCVPGLTYDVITSMTNGYVIGSSPTEVLSVAVHNIGDPAYSSCVRVQTRGVRVSRWPRSCARENATSAVCKPEQPIKNNTNWNSGTIELETEGLRSDTRSVSFTAEMFDQCRDPTSSKGRKTETFFLITDPPDKLFLSGSSQLGDTVYLTKTEVEETGKQILHSYVTFNMGGTVWVDVVCDIFLKKAYYLSSWAVTIDTSATYNCSDISNETHYHSRCIVTELRSRHKFDTILSIYLVPSTIESIDNLDQLKLTLSSDVTVTFDRKYNNNTTQQPLQHRVTSNLRRRQGLVPWWMILTAGLIGLLILVIIAFILRECGCLRRKNREKLQSLKKDVHRQSMRRSMSIRESARSASSAAGKKDSDKEKLIKDQSEENISPHPDKTAPKIDVTALKNDAEAPASDKVSCVVADKAAPVADEMAPVSNKEARPNDEPLVDIEASVVDSDKINKKLILQKNMSVEMAPVSDKETRTDEEPLFDNKEEESKEAPVIDSDKMNKQLIILGLQKNIRVEMAPVSEKETRSDEEPLVDNKEEDSKEAPVMESDTMKKQHIILGLQKNINSRKYPIVPPKPKRYEEDDSK